MVRYSNLAAQRHGIQFEINRTPYMNEQTLTITPAFVLLKKQLQSLEVLLLTQDTRNL